MRRQLATMAALGLGLTRAALAADGDPLVYREAGKASYYDDALDGQKTASGARLDQDKLTAAHPKLPLGSEVTVTNPDNGRSVEVEINDRGPHAKDRAIDLSKAAARKLGITGQGVAEVEIEATRSQLDQAIGVPKDGPEVARALAKARSAAAADGTPQPPLPDQAR